MRRVGKWEISFAEKKGGKKVKAVTLVML